MESVGSPARLGDAVSANGVNQYVSLPAINLSATNAVTWAAWVNRTYSTAGGHTLFENSTNFNSSTTGFGFFPDDGVDCPTSSPLMTGVHGNVGYTLNCYAQPSSGVWHHIAVVYDKSHPATSVISLYIDGALQTPKKNLYTATNTNSFGNNALYVFSRGGTQEFNAGEIDDLRLYNRALSASEMQQIYQAGSASLVSIAVTPANASIAKGTTQQFTATGTYSDSSTQNLTSSVTWTSSNTTVATITSGGSGDGSGHGERDDSGGFRLDQRLHGSNGDGAGIGVDCGDAGEPFHFQWHDAAIHGHGDLQRQQHPEPDQFGDLEFDEHGGGDDHELRAWRRE